MCLKYLLVSGTIYNRKKISWDFSSSNWHFGSRKQKASVPLCELLSISVQTSVLVQLLSCVWLFATPWTAAPQASLPITYSQSLLKLMSIELVVPSNHLILCRPLCLLPSMFPSIKVFSMIQIVQRLKSKKISAFPSYVVSLLESNQYG